MDWKENKSYRLAMLAAFLHAGSNLALWCFNREGKLYYTTSSYEKELDAFLEIGGCKEYALTEGTKLDKPFIMSDAMGLIWVGEYADVTDNIGRVLVLMGPMFNSETSFQTIEERMLDHPDVNNYEMYVKTAVENELERRRLI